MNAFLEKLLKSMLAISTTLFQIIGENIIDNFTNIYRAIILLALTYILLTGLISDGVECLKKFFFTLMSVSLVYFIVIDFPNFKYYIFDTIIKLPGSLSDYLKDISILGKNISKGDSITKIIWDTIKNDLFGVLTGLKPWDIFSNIFLIATVIFTAYCLLTLYINYWIVYFIFVFEITILGIMGLPIILMSPLKTFRPILFAWAKAIFGAVLPPVILSLIMLIVKGFIVENTINVAKATQINKVSAQNAIESIAVVSLLAVIVAKQIGKYVAILTGVQDNAFNLFKPAGAALGAMNRGQNLTRATKMVGRGLKSSGSVIKSGAQKVGKTMQGLEVDLKMQKKLRGVNIQGLNLK